MKRNLPQKQAKDNKQSRYLRFISLGILTISLTVSCSNTKPVVSIDPLERNAHIMVNSALSGKTNEDITQAAIQAALSQYAVTDNLLGQWRIHQLKTKLALQTGQQLKAEASLEQLSWLAAQIDDTGIQYQTALTRGRVKQDSGDYRKALSLAGTPLQAANAHTFLGETEMAVNLVKGLVVDETNADSLAFIYYQHAKQISSKKHYVLALNAYRSAGDSRGIADALVALAKLSYKIQQTERADIYARRAIIVLEALGESKKALGVRRLLSSWQQQ